MREMKNSGIEWIGEIPVGWDVTLLSALFKERKCKNKGMIETNLLSLSYGNIKRKDITSNEGLLPDSYETYNIIENGNIVFRLTDLQNDKRSLRTGLCKERGIITSAYITLELEQKDNPAYMYYLFHTYDLCKVFYGMGDGVRQGANYEDLKKLRVIRPSSPEQHRISAYLDTKCEKIDSIIARQQEVIEKLKAYKLSVITEAVTKGLNPDVRMKDSGVEWIGDVPEHWENRKLKTLVSMISKGTTPSTIGKDILVEGKVRFLKAENIQNNQIQCEPEFYIDEETDEILKRSRLKESDILYVIAGATIGKTAIMESSFLPANTNQAVSFIRLNDVKNAKYVWYYLQSNYIKVILNQLSVQSAQPNLSMEDMGNFYVCFPPEDERAIIANYLDKKCSAIDSAIAKKQAIIEKLTAYKKSLIYEVVTGKREV